MTLTLCINSTPCAQGFTPASLAARGILADWLRASNSRQTTAQLDAALRTGQPVELAAGAWLEWRSEE